MGVGVLIPRDEDLRKMSKLRVFGAMHFNEYTNLCTFDTLLIFLFRLVQKDPPPLAFDGFGIYGSGGPPHKQQPKRIHGFRVSGLRVSGLGLRKVQGLRGL